MLAVAHDLEFLLLQHLHATDLQGPSAEDIQQGLHLIIKVKELVVPNLRFAASKGRYISYPILSAMRWRMTGLSGSGSVCEAYS